jgi:hypothetical protein
LGKGGPIDLVEQSRELTQGEGAADRRWPQFNDEAALSAGKCENEISVLD